jgi:hypothetical protein
MHGDSHSAHDDLVCNPSSTGGNNDASLEDHDGATALSRLTVHCIEESATALSADVSADEMLHWLELSAVLLRRAKELRSTVERVAVEWIERNGDLRSGPLHYTVRHPRETKCVDVPAAVHLVLAACGGDLDAFAAYLRSDPFKYGSCRDALGGAAFAKVFRTTVRAKLVGDQPAKVLCRVRPDGPSGARPPLADAPDNDSDDAVIDGGSADDDRNNEHN